VVIPAAHAACLRIARRHYENFPVASWLLPAEARPHVAALYAFARMADDMADEGNDPPDSRLAQLADWRDRLHAAAAGRAPAGSDDAAVVFTALMETIRAHELPVSLFDDLISAFEQDVIIARYADWPDVLDYCRRSANPIGRLVLRICGYRDALLDTCSDAVCTALQLTNFWQDFADDWRKGRLYLPATWVHDAGAHEHDLDAGIVTPAWRTVLRQAAVRTGALFAAGRPVVDRVHGRLSWELRATWLGGMRILTRLEARDFAVFDARPVLGWPDAAVIGWRALVWRRAPHAPVVR
jgi:squalene synthase HpnC